MYFSKPTSKASATVATVKINPPRTSSLADGARRVAVKTCLLLTNV